MHPDQTIGMMLRPFSGYRDLKWPLRFLELAELVASWSKDRSTQVGAVIFDGQRRVLSVGYNGMPRGADDDRAARHERPEKYFWMEHAERNAIYNLERKTEDMSIVVTHPPCMDCARGIVQTGIKTVFIPRPDSFDEAFRSRWKESFDRLAALFSECGVELVYLGL